MVIRVITPARVCQWVWVLPVVAAIPELLLWEPMGCQDCHCPRRGPSSPVLGQQEPKHLMVTFNQHLPQQSRKVWSKCASLASCPEDSPGESWTQRSVRNASSDPGLQPWLRKGREPPTHGLWIWPPGSRCTNLPCIEEIMSKKEIQDSSAPQPA